MIKMARLLLVGSRPFTDDEKKDIDKYIVNASNRGLYKREIVAKYVYIMFRNYV